MGRMVVAHASRGCRRGAPRAELVRARRAAPFQSGAPPRHGDARIGDARDSGRWRMPRMKTMVFDSHEALLDLCARDPHFARAVGDASARERDG